MNKSLRIDFHVMSAETERTATSIFHSDKYEVRIIRSGIQSSTAPVIVSAGNSFGNMDGGVDGMINCWLSSYNPDDYIESYVKREIWFQWSGELPVGASVCVPVHRHPTCKYLIYSPTMRVPEELPEDTINPYLAFRSSIVCAVQCGFQHIATPIFCTGAGGVSVEKSLKQMKEAIQNVLRTEFYCPFDIRTDWKHYHEHHRKLKRM